MMIDLGYLLLLLLYLSNSYMHLCWRIIINYSIVYQKYTEV